MSQDLQDILNKIKQMQTTEQGLYSTLTQNAENVALGKPNTFSDSEIDNITTQINSLSAARVNLFNLISESYQQEMSAETNAQQSLEQQTQTLQLLEQELNKAKKNMSKMKDEKYNQLKMIEINTYYSKQYDAHRRLMRMIAIIGVCLIIAIGLENTALSVASKPLVVLILVVGGFLVVRRVINMFLRKSDNYDEFDWPFIETNPSNSASSSSNPIGVEVNGNVPYICASEYCCGEGTMWKTGVGCVVNPNMDTSANNAVATTNTTS